MGRNLILYYLFKIPREKVLWAKGLCQLLQDSGMAVLDFEDKASENNFPWLSPGSPNLFPCWFPTGMQWQPSYPKGEELWRQRTEAATG